MTDSQDADPSLLELPDNIYPDKHTRTDSQDTDPPGLKLPDKIYPDSTWAFQKASPKTSLEDIGQAQTARQVILNLIELIHWHHFH
jgi:hypothetical protein